jgi:hypothetical protein
MQKIIRLFGQALAAAPNKSFCKKKDFFIKREFL